MATRTKTAPNGDAILTIEGLRGEFRSPHGKPVQILRGVDLSLRRGAITAIVGETGSGKTLTTLTMLGLAPRTFRRTAGSIVFDGTDITEYDETGLRKIRGSQIAMVFQNSKAALNPVFTIGTQLRDVCRLQQSLDKRTATQRAEDLLDQVRVSEPHARLRQYPHELSGGTAQRVQIAMALACQPSLLILDEPTTGLDVTIQADILELIVQVTGDTGMSTCMITHDLGVVAEMCDDVVVMRGGETCEAGSCAQVMTKPRHDYTKQLLAASRAEVSVS